jgi:hypothetical protein
METIIKKAKIKDGCLIVELTEIIDTKDGTIYNDVVKTCGSVVHQDLQNAFDGLKLHLVKICDLRFADVIDRNEIGDFDMSLLNEYTITGFSIGGHDENEGVTIVGNKKLKSGKVLNICAPFTKFWDEFAPYELETFLRKSVDNCIDEVGKYLTGKSAVTQTEMDFNSIIEPLKNLKKMGVTVTAY